MASRRRGSAGRFAVILAEICQALCLDRAGGCAEPRVETFAIGDGLPTLSISDWRSVRQVGQRDSFTSLRRVSQRAQNQRIPPSRSPGAALPSRPGSSQIEPRVAAEVDESAAVQGECIVVGAGGTGGAIDQGPVVVAEAVVGDAVVGAAVFDPERDRVTLVKEAEARAWQALIRQAGGCHLLEAHAIGPGAAMKSLKAGKTLAAVGVANNKAMMPAFARNLAAASIARGFLGLGQRGDCHP